MKNPIVLFALCCLLGSTTACQAQSNSTTPISEGKQMDLPEGVFISLEGDTLEPLMHTNEYWKDKLDAEEYRVIRLDGTERAFTGKYWDNKKVGVYTCAACSLPLFDSKTKYRSGTGWPSYYEPIRADHVAEKEDNTYGMVRIEVECARCGGHLGHVFEDGPQPTGLRYCINGTSLDFIPEEEQ